jgi:5-methylcytosine-specific restriction endonuclease McrA
MQHPLCEDCSGRGTVEAATEVHHIEKVRRRPELRLAWGNLMPLCDGCHNARTARGE